MEGEKGRREGEELGEGEGREEEGKGFARPCQTTSYTPVSGKTCYLFVCIRTC